MGPTTIGPMRMLLLLSVLCFSFSSFAGEIVLLTSLKLNFLNVGHLEGKFKKAFKNLGHDLVIHHKVDPKTLHSVLTSENTEAVIWVSHAAGEHELKPGFKAEDIILDYWGNDVKNFFTLVPANMKFLGLVGCQANLIVNGFRERGNYDRYPNLEIMSFDKKVRLYNAFDKALAAAVEYLKAPRTGDAPVSSAVVDFEIRRSSYEDSPSLQAGWVEMGDQVLSFLDVNEVDAPVANLDQSLFEKIPRKNIKFFRAKSKDSVEAESLGKLEIGTSQNLGTWTLFAKDGKPIGGRDQQLYVFKKAQN